MPVCLLSCCVRMWGREKLCDANKERRGILLLAPLYTHTKQNRMLSKILPRRVFAQYVNCAAANPGADAGMYDASDQYTL